MSKRATAEVSGFGARLVSFRKAAGFTQADLARVVGVSRRMIAYYEGETQHPPTTILPRLAHAFGISTDELLAVESPAHGKAKIECRDGTARSRRTVARSGT